MGFATKVQLIKRKLSEQWYINFPSAVAQAMNFKKGETVEWVVEDRTQLVLNRLEPPDSVLKKKRRKSARSSGSSGKDAGGPSSNSAAS